MERPFVQHSHFFARSLQTYCLSAVWRDCTVSIALFCCIPVSLRFQLLPQPSPLRGRNLGVFDCSRGKCCHDGADGCSQSPPRDCGLQARYSSRNQTSKHALSFKFIPFLSPRSTSLFIPSFRQLIAAEEALQKSRGKNGRREDEE